MAPQTTNAPHFDAAELFGQDYGIPQTVNAPFLDVGFGFAPSIIHDPVAGLVVKQGTTVLSQSKDRSWRDELVGAGSWGFTLPNGDPDMPDFDDIVSFEVDGEVRFAGPVQRKNATTHAVGEGAQQLTQLSGFGRLAVTNKSVIAPSRGWNALPVEVTVSESWVAPGYDDSGWAYAKRIRRADQMTPFTPGSREIPEWWPDKSAWWVAPNRADITTVEAPLGSWPFRSDPITLAAGTIEILTSVNNLGRVHFDGAVIADLNNAPGDGNRVRLEVSAGDHLLSGYVTNYIRDTGFIASIWTVDDDGLLDTLVWSSDADNVRAIPYPDPFPMTNAGVAIRHQLERVQTEEGELLDVTLDFNDFVDSDGEPWEPIVEVAVDVGRTFQEFLEAMSDWAVDVQMAPGANVVRAWNWGTRGGAPGVTIAATTDRRTSEVAGLSFDGLHKRANRLRIRYRGGYTVVDESGPDDTVTAFLDLSEYNETTARNIGTRLLALRKEPSYAGVVSLAPVSSQPYETFDNGDTVGHPADPGGSSSSRVRAILGQENETGVLSYVVELNDVRMETEARQENWLKRSAMGALAGGARVTSRTGESIPPAQKTSVRDVAEFSFQDPTAGAITAKDPAKSSGNLIEFYVEVTTEDGSPSSSSSQVRVYLNGVSLGTVTVPAGEDAAEFDLSAQKVYRNVDRLRAEVVTVGGGVNGITVQVRAI